MRDGLLPAPAMALLVEPWPPGPNAPRPCPVCGQPWRPWAWSRLPCHARCLFRPEDDRALLVAFWSTVGARAELARSLGITDAALASALKAAKRRRAR